MPVLAMTSAGPDENLAFPLDHFHDIPDLHVSIPRKPCSDQQSNFRTAGQIPTSIPEVKPLFARFATLVPALALAIAVDRSDLPALAALLARGAPLL